MAGLLWHLLMLSLKCPKEMDQQLLKARIIAAADVHLQYMQELEAEPSSITGASAELLIAVLAGMPPLLCLATFTYISQPEHLLDDVGLVLAPGILNAAMLQLAGLGKYLHTLQIGKQSPGLKRSDQGAGGRASSSTSSSSGRRAVKIIRASSFAQLQLPADHEGVRVVGGGRAVGAVSKRLEMKDMAVDTGDFVCMLSGELSMAIYLFCVAISCSQQDGSSSTGGTSSGDSSSGGGGTGGGVGVDTASSSSTGPEGCSRNTTWGVQVLMGSFSNAADGDTDFLGAPLLQLLLELQALVGSFQLDMVKKCEPLDMFLRAEEAETVALLSARGGLLLQVLWLKAQDSNQQQQEDGEVLWLNVLRVCHLKVFAEPPAISSSGESLAPVPRIVGCRRRSKQAVGKHADCQRPKPEI